MTNKQIKEALAELMQKETTLGDAQAIADELACALSYQDYDDDLDIYLATGNYACEGYCNKFFEVEVFAGYIQITRNYFLGTSCCGSDTISNDFESDFKEIYKHDCDLDDEEDRDNYFELVGEFDGALYGSILMVIYKISHGLTTDNFKDSYFFEASVDGEEVK